MKVSELINARLANQQISMQNSTSIKKLVSFMGAMQAQDFAMSKWAVGMRLKNITQQKVELAINKGDLIRIHALRPTWHLVSADDVYWMLQLTAPSIKASMKNRDKQLELTDALYNKANKIIENALREKHHTREDLMNELRKRKIIVNENRSSHFMLRAELDGIICSGAISDNKFTYALLNERVKKKKDFTKDEALKLLATRYFQSHGPAKLSDFMWWSGINAKDATQAVNSLDKSFVKEIYLKETYWLKQNAKISANNYIFLLPAYDEYIISYKDRSAVVSNESSKKVTSANGIFWPVILANGKVVGKWNRKITDDKVKVEFDLFNSISSSLKNKLHKSAEEYAGFLNKKLI